MRGFRPESTDCEQQQKPYLPLRKLNCYFSVRCNSYQGSKFQLQYHAKTRWVGLSAQTRRATPKELRTTDCACIAMETLITFCFPGKRLTPAEDQQMHRSSAQLQGREEEVFDATLGPDLVSLQGINYWYVCILPEFHIKEPVS